MLPEPRTMIGLVPAASSIVVLTVMGLCNRTESSPASASNAMPVTSLTVVAGAPPMLNETA
jgi:hypothetical protein